MNGKWVGGWMLGGGVALALVAALVPFQGRPPTVEGDPVRTGSDAPIQATEIIRASYPVSRSSGASPEISPHVKVALMERGDELPRSGVWDDEAWQRIPLDKAFAESLGDLPLRRAFSSGMRDPPALATCAEGWTAPPGVRQIDMKLELRVRSADETLVVEDVQVREANIADADLERCVVSSLRGRKVAAPGVAPGQAYRLEWSARKYL